MADLQSHSGGEPHEMRGAELPGVEVEVRQGGRTATYALDHVDFLVGTVPGCDLRIPGTDLPPVLCILARQPRGLVLRKLAPTQVLLVNGQSASHAELVHGDRVTVGATDLFVRLKSVALPPSQPRSLSQPADLAPPESPKLPSLDSQREELSRMRQELANIRRELYERYQERRDRLAGLQAAVDHAARKVQERKRQLDTEEADQRRRGQEDKARQTALEERAAALAEQVSFLEQERRLFQESQGALAADLEKKRADLKRREDELLGKQRDLDARIAQYQSDLVRLDRLQGTLDEREKKLAGQENDYQARFDQLRSDTADMEEQVAQLDGWRLSLQQQTDQLEAERKTHEEAAAELGRRAALVEGQQATLAALRTRLERAREEVRQREQQLDTEKARQDAAQADFDARWRTLLEREAQLESTQQLQDQERHQLAERGAMVDAAVHQLRQAQDKATQQEQECAERATDLDRRAAELFDKEGVVEGRLRQLSEAQERLDLERQAVRERTQALTQTELAREALQEQLRKRAEELNARHRTLDEKMQEYEARAAALDARQAEIQRQHDQAQVEAEQWRQQQQAQTDNLQTQTEELARREAQQKQQLEQLQELESTMAAERKALAEERMATRQEQEKWLRTQGESRAEFEKLRQEAIELARQLPDVELRAGTALERLTHAREQLRDHLTELHGYVQQCRDDLDAAHGRLQQEETRLQEQEQALRRGQEEHRLAMVAFRQQMIGWQGQIADLKRLLASDATRLELREAQVEERAREVGVASQEIAERAEALAQEEQHVAGKRQEIDRHLLDMREWYRHKLRELAGMDQTEASAAGTPDPAVVPLAMAMGLESSVGPEPSPDEEALIPTGRDILSLTEPVDAGDRRLGELLSELELIDGDTLGALLIEARRQRRSLRQVLLAGGVVTLYQLALIEAGNIAGLMLGPLRVIDRLRAGAHETVYRVFDPRRGTEALLRHLAEADMLDAVRPDEFRQRFAQAMVVHPHIAGTLEVLDIDGRPAVLEEWLTGLPSSDWPPLTAAPGVCFRLLMQAALALDTLHKAGLVHGHLSESAILLTPEGILKVAGAGEPAWLWSSSGEAPTEPQTDLVALGHVVAGWCTPTGVRKGTKSKPLPEALVAILHRLTVSGAEAYPGAADLLADLDRAGNDVPANAEAWERLLRHVREHANPEALARRSA